jgi:outer membrane protein
MRRSHSSLLVLLLTFSTILFSQLTEAETLTFKKALELASTHSTGVGIARADQMRAQSSYLEARNAYIPALTTGSGLGISWGFPLSLEGSAPSIFNVTAQSTVFNLAQNSFVRAARNERSAMGYNTDDQRNQALLDAAVTYTQLDGASAKLKILLDQSEQAKRAEYITQQRVKEGVDSQMELTRASLNAARTRLRLTETQGAVDVLKQHLSQLTGVAAGEIEIDSESIPKMPDFSQDEGVVNRALANNPAVKTADEHFKSKEQQAKGEHNALYPSIDFAAQYALLAKYNNYEEFYKAFQRNNATIGVAVRFTFLNPVQRARAQGAAAESLRAKSEAEATRNQVSSQALKLQRALPQLAAARDVSKLEWELAQGNLDAVTAKLLAGNANLRDQENARIDVNDKYATYLDASFDYDKARLQLMSMTGDLHDWALGTP